MTEFQKLDTMDGLTIKDHFLTQEEFSLRRNLEYGYLETCPQPKDLEKYYKSEAYISHTDANKSLFDKFYQVFKTYNIRYKFSKLSQIEKGKTLLDIGCGTGDFLAYAKNKGLEVFGIEPNLDAREIAKRKIGAANLFEQDLETIDQQFDYITLWHVLEHIPDLDATMKTIHSKLKEGGELIIALPNYNSLDAKFYKTHWAAFDVPRHLHHFSPQDFEKWSEAMRMKTVKKYPLYFDSFYVSLLSEKYKKNPLGILRAPFIGALSNFKGIFNGNYSSIIYKLNKY